MKKERNKDLLYRPLQPLDNLACSTPRQIATTATATTTSAVASVLHTGWRVVGAVRTGRR